MHLEENPAQQEFGRMSLHLLKPLPAGLDRGYPEAPIAFGDDEVFVDRVDMVPRKVKALFSYPFWRLS